MRIKNLSKLTAKKVLLIVSVALVFTMLGSGIAIATFEQTAKAEAAKPTATVAPETTTADAANPGYDAVYSANNPVVDIAARITKSVVGVSNMQKTWNRYDGTVTMTEVGSGSGVVIDSRGYIVTNYHVIADANEVSVWLEDGTKHPAEIIGFDSTTDIAVLKVTDVELTPVTIGDSDKLRVGELAVAIGNPGGEVLSSTVTAGIISAINRNIEAFDRAVYVIQTDAAINPGNSGGALLNAKGELIGINTLKFGTSVYSGASYEGLGFAIPSNTFKPLVDQIIEKGKVIRPRMGISLSVRDNAPDEALRDYPPAGMVIEVVEKDSPADLGGLREKDIITHINGTRIKSMRDITAITDSMTAGNEITVTVYRQREDGTYYNKVEDNIVEVKVKLEIID